MTIFIEVDGDWVKGVPVQGQKFKHVTDGGGELISYYSEPVTPALPTKLSKRALSQRLNPVIREALRNTTDETAIDIYEDFHFDRDLSDPDLKQSLAYLVYAGFMTQEESDYVLNTPVTSGEI